MKLSEYFGVNFEHSEKCDLIGDIKALLIARSLSGWEIDTLNVAWDKGVMESGDTPCKSSREQLLDKGVLCQTCCKKNDYTFSVTYPLGYKVYQALSIKFI